MTSKFRNPWIDRRVLNVRSAAAMEYMRRHGWDPVPCANDFVQMFAGPVADSGRRITHPVPFTENDGEYVQRIIELITNLAILEDRTAVEVLDEMLGVTVPSGNGTTNGSANGKVAEPAPAPTA